MKDNILISNQERRYTTKGYVRRFPKQAKESIERLTSKNRNISVAEFRSILGNVNNELSG